MRKLAVAMALASTAIVATPALARDKSWYVGVEGGAMIVEDVKFDINSIKGASTADHRYGYDVDGVIGYDLGNTPVAASAASPATLRLRRAPEYFPATLASAPVATASPTQHKIKNIVHHNSQ